MTVRVFIGSKQEIARDVAGIDGEVREAIVFVDEGIARGAGAGAGSPAGEAVADLFAEMEPYAVAVDDFDDSREAIYARLRDE